MVPIAAEKFRIYWRNHERRKHPKNFKTKIKKKNINDLIKKRLYFNIFPNKKMDIKKLKTWFIMS